MKALQTLATEDFQKREESGRPPRSNIPDDIQVYGKEVFLSFKNTTPADGKAWAKRFLEGYKIKDMKVSQTGDYTNDWIEVKVITI